MKTERFSVRGLELAYHRFGDPSDFPILMLHGFMDHGLAYAPVIRALPEPFHVIAPDHRGFGHSAWIGDGGYYYFQDYFQDTVRLIEHLGLEQLGIVGHSMGGSIATGVGALMPERVKAMVLIEGMGPPFSNAADSVGRLRRWVESTARLDRARREVMPDVAAAAEKMRRVNPRLSEEISLELAGTMTEPLAAGVAWRMDPLHRTPSPKAYLRPEVEPLWRALTMPVLSLYGTDTPFRLTDLGERHACLPNATTIDVDGAGHNIHHEQPERIARWVADWMRGRPVT